MIRTNGQGVVYGEVWYDEEPPPGRSVDIILYRQRRMPVENSHSTPFLSMITDLCGAPDELAKQFGKDCRYKIRRADARDGLRMEFILEPESRLDEFRAFYDAFAQQKSVRSCDPHWLAAACTARQLVLTTACRNGEALVWHGYVLTPRTAWLQYTSSCFRDKDNEYRALVGRANRWLHWQDMLRFRELGLQRYDWGGLFEDESTPERAGINAFKKDFGGQRERSFDCTLPVTLKGRVYLPLRDAWRRLNDAAPVRAVARGAGV